MAVTATRQGISNETLGISPWFFAVSAVLIGGAWGWLVGSMAGLSAGEKIESISPTLREVVASHVEPVTPVVLRWQGKVSPDELAAFYEEVATQLPSRPELHIQMTVKAEIPASAVKTNVAQMEIALRRLGLDDHVTVEAA